MWSRVQARSPAAFAARLLALACVGASLGEARTALACTPCSSGDPMLATLGAEQPFAGLLRSGLSFAYRTEEAGAAGVDLVTLEEYRGELFVVWAPLTRLLLIGTVPVLERQSIDVALRERRTRGLGDVALRSQLLIFRDRTFAPRHRLSAIAGLEFPTAPLLRDADERLLPYEAQTGTGWLQAGAGLTYVLTHRPWSAYASVDVGHGLFGPAELEPGASFRASLAGQRELLDWLSPRLVAEARWEGQSTERGELVADSGGTLLLAGADLLFAIGEDLGIITGARLPVFAAHNGNQREGWTASLTVTHDW